MSTEIERVTIVGGGDSGLLTALCLQRLNPTIDIQVIDDSAEARSDVGKSTFKAIIDILHDFLGIDRQEFIREVRPVFKTSVYFRDWCGCDSFHYPFDLLTTMPSRLQEDSGERYYHLYETEYVDQSYQTVNEAMFHTRKAPYYFTGDGSLDVYDYFAYHLDVDRFNSFLKKVCHNRGISFINDRIIQVETAGNVIKFIASSDTKYDADLFIDASGFTRLLKQEQDCSFREFELPLDAAINTRIDRPIADIEPATIIDTGDYGWFWQIDTFDYRDVGYVYASEFIDQEAAISEFQRHCCIEDQEVQLRQYNFSSGYFPNSWKANCIAIGNAAGFVEPLQSTGLTANAQAALILSILLAGNSRQNHGGIRENFNTYVQCMWETIYDFILVHYLYANGDGDFWQQMQLLAPTARVEAIIECFDQNGVNTAVNPIKYDPEARELVLFSLEVFYAIMRKMGAESVFYESARIEVSDKVVDERSQMYEAMQNDVKHFLTTEQFYRTLLNSDDITTSTT